jgi:hypothetical protein
MVLHMKAVAELKTELTVEERNLLSVAFKVRTTGKLCVVECEKKMIFFFFFFFFFFFVFVL